MMITLLTNHRMQLRHISQHPHEITASQCQNERSPDCPKNSVSASDNEIPRPGSYTWLGPFGVNTAAAIMRATVTTKTKSTGNIEAMTVEAFTLGFSSLTTRVGNHQGYCRS